MNRYLLPITINNRRAVIMPLGNGNTSSNYIVASDTFAGKVQILRVDKTKQLQTLILNTSDIILNKLNFTVTYLNNTLNIHLNNSAKEEDVTHIVNWRKQAQTKVTENNLNAILLDNGLTLLVQNDNAALTIYVQFTQEQCINNLANNCLPIKINYNNSIANFAIDFATTASYIHFGLDFGSESSQIRHKQYNKVGQEVFEQLEDPSLFQTLADYKKANGKPEEFYQYEKDTPFLKSIFFVNKTLETADKNLEEEFFLPKQENIITIKKTQETDALFFNEWLPVPNLKLCHKHGNDLHAFNLNVNKPFGKTTVTLDKVKTQLYGSVLKDLLLSYLSSLLYPNKVYDIRLNLLVPNIYDYQDLAKTKHAIQEIIDYANKEIFNNAIRSFELVTLSESDASYMGYFNTANNIAKPNAYYIIIDCGKGTTDYSIVKTESEAQNFKNVYRDGFAGAGNLLTYACFEAFCFYVVKNSNNPQQAKQYFEQLFLKLQGGQKQLFYEHIERYKKNYNFQASENDVVQVFNQAVTGSINFKNLFDDTAVSFETLISLMQQINTVYNWNNYISDATIYITQTVANGLADVMQNLNAKQITCGGVLLSGRGFLCSYLQEATINKLAEMGIGAHLIHQPKNAKDYKSICMQGIFKQNYIFNSDIMCMPIQLDIKHTKTENNTTPSFLNALLKGKINIIDLLVKQDFSFNEQENTLKITTNNLNELRFIIGNAFYQIADLYLPNVGNLQLQFDNNRFLVRSIDNSNKLIGTSPLILDTVVTENFSKNIYASLFPMVLDITQMHFLNTTYLNKSLFYPTFIQP